MRRDQAQFEAFVRDVSHRLLRLAWLLTGNPRREDLVQGALERVYVAWPRLDEGGTVNYAASAPPTAVACPQVAMGSAEVSPGSTRVSVAVGGECGGSAIEARFPVAVSVGAAQQPSHTADLAEPRRDPTQAVPVEPHLVVVPAYDSSPPLALAFLTEGATDV